MRLQMLKVQKLCSKPVWWSCLIGYEVQMNFEIATHFENLLHSLSRTDCGYSYLEIGRIGKIEGT